MSVITKATMTPSFYDNFVIIDRNLEIPPGFYNYFKLYFYLEVIETAVLLAELPPLLALHIALT